MSYMNHIHSHFTEICNQFMQSDIVQRLTKGDFTKAHYASLFREIYHYTRDNPQALGYATVFFRGDEREMVQMMLKHAASEAGHDQMALADMASLGFSTKGIPTENPLPETMALTSYIFYTISRGCVLGFLGYVYFLEFLATSHGPAFVEGFARAGIPESSMSFLLEHVKADVAHNKLMQRYIETFVRDESDCGEVVYGMQVSANLYQKLFEASFRRVDTNEHYGRNKVEVAYQFKAKSESYTLA